VKQITEQSDSAKSHWSPAELRIECRDLLIAAVLLSGGTRAMGNQYEPFNELPALPESLGSKQARSPDWTQGMWYMLLIPVACAYASAAREYAGPGFTDAPNQGAMVAFFLMVVAWPFIAIAIIAIFRRILRIRGIAADSLGFLAWLASSAVPFLIGMK
jgi:hypothetical protein